jgi:hypothetical protein
MKPGYKGHLNTRNKFPKSFFFQNPKISWSRWLCHHETDGARVRAVFQNCRWWPTTWWRCCIPASAPYAGTSGAHDQGNTPLTSEWPDSEIFPDCGDGHRGASGLATSPHLVDDHHVWSFRHGCALVSAHLGDPFLPSIRDARRGCATVGQRTYPHCRQGHHHPHRSGSVARILQSRSVLRGGGGWEGWQAVRRP